MIYLQCIGATTLDEYRKHIEKDPALERRFQPVKVPEPTVDETIQILKGLRERYEIHHKLRYTDESLVAAAQLSYQYIRYGVFHNYLSHDYYVSFPSCICSICRVYRLDFVCTFMKCYYLARLFFFFLHLFMPVVFFQSRTVILECSVLTTTFACFSDRFLPDKAIDLVDEAGSRVRLRHAQVGSFKGLVFISRRNI